MNVSLILLAYNQEKYIREAMISVLGQKCQPLEIIVSDDCSTDNTFKIIQEVISEYHGFHKIIINRNEKNLGIAQHFNKVVFDFCHGDIILTADGDDISFPDRAKRTLELFTENPEIKGLSFGKILIEKNGNLIAQQIEESPEIIKMNFQDYIDSGIVTFCGSSRAFKRGVMDFFGPLKYSDGNDIFVFNRCLMTGGYLYSNEKMIYYRIHEHNTDRSENYTRETIQKAKMQLKYDLEFAVSNNLVSYSDAVKALKYRIYPIIRIFLEKHYSYYHPRVYRLKKFIGKIYRKIKKTMKLSNANNGY